MSDARILDRGYRRYDGPRRGLAGAVRSLAWQSALRALGLRRTFWAKVFPLLSAGIAYLPAAVFVGVAALVPGELAEDADLLPTYADYYGFITAAIVIFVALVGPEVLCPDRRNGMLGLYLASPLTRDSYLVAKVLAVLPVLGIVTLGPPLLLLVGLTLADAGPDDVGDFLTILGRVVVGGAIVAAPFTAVSLAAASLTDRRAVASAGVILLLLVSSVTTSILVEELDVDVRLYLLNLFLLPFELVQRVYGEPGAEPQLTTVELALAVVAWTVGGAVVLRERYRRLRVDAVSADVPGDVPGAVVEVAGVSKWFGDVVAVSDVTFDVGPGVTALLGPNGAGKSTVLRLLCGLTRPSQGTVRVLGHDPHGDPALYRRIGLVPQQEALFEGLTGLAFVRLAADLHGLDDPGRSAAAALDLVELDPADRRPVSAYSKGMRQRVKVAQAVVHDPEVVVLDEPLEGLDPRQRLHLIELFRRLGADGRCVIVSSHVLDEVERFGSRVLVLAQGRLAAEGDFHAIRELMDDRPHRLRLRTDDGPGLAAALVASGAAVGVRLAGDAVVVDTVDVVAFRHTVAAAAQRTGARLLELVPLDDDLESVFRYLVDGRPAERQPRR